MSVLSVAETCYRLLYCSFVDLGYAHMTLCIRVQRMCWESSRDICQTPIGKGRCALAYLFFFFTVQERLCFSVQLGRKKSIHTFFFETLRQLADLCQCIDIQWDTSDVH